MSGLKSVRSTRQYLTAIHRTSKSVCHVAGFGFRTRKEEEVLSATTVQTIIRRAVSDADFRAVLMARPTETLAEFDLTAEERDRLCKLDASMFDGSPSDLEDRLSRGGVWVPN